VAAINRPERGLVDSEEGIDQDRISCSVDQSEEIGGHGVHVRPVQNQSSTTGMLGLTNTSIQMSIRNVLASISGSVSASRLL